jgi:hypothetical protein
MSNPELALQARRWASSIGLDELPNGWVLRFTLSTVPIENWFYRRNKLKPDSIQLTLSVPDYGLWVAQLERHDELFQVQWRTGDDLRVQSQQLKYTRLVAWPRLQSLEEFPKLVSAIEPCIGIRFIRHADVGARMLDSKLLTSNPTLRNWLSPCVDTVGCLMRNER